MTTYHIPYPALTQEAETTIGQHLEKLLPIRRGDGRYDLSKVVGAALQNWQDDVPQEKLHEYALRYSQEAAGSDSLARLISLPAAAAERINEIGAALEQHQVPLLKVRKGYNIRLILVIAMLRYGDALKG